jgi:hypothetical protein
MDFMEENKWESDISEDEYEDEYVQNDVPPPSLDREFVENILSIKHSLYDDIILSPQLGTNSAQDNKLTQKYLNDLNQVYILTINAKNGNVDDRSLEKYSPKTRELIKKTLNWIHQFFNKNKVVDLIPYEDYLYRMFREYQFVQDNSFE